MEQNSLLFECQVTSKSPVLKSLAIKVKKKSLYEMVDKNLEEIQKEAALDGFRKGKVPLPLIKKHYLPQAQKKALEEVLTRSLFNAMDQNKIKYVSDPKIMDVQNASFDDDLDLSFSADVETFERPALGDISKLKVKKYVPKVTPHDVNREVAALQKVHAVVESPREGEVEFTKKAESGDTISVNFEGKIDGQAIQGFSANNYVLKMGESGLLPELEKTYEGMKAGETKTTSVNFPETHPDQQVAGKTVEFFITMNEVKHVTLPEIDDDFAKRFGFETLLELKKGVENHMQHEKTHEADDKTHSSVIDALLRQNPCEVPESFVNQELKESVGRIYERLSQQGFSKEAISLEIEKNLEELKKGALDRVRSSLLLDIVADENKIMISPEDLKHEIEHIAMHSKGDPETVHQRIMKDQNELKRVSFFIRQRKVLEFLLEKAQVEVIE